MPVSAVTEMSEFRDILPLNRGVDVLRIVIDVLQRRLPTTWTLDPRDVASGSRVDAELRLRAPDGQEAVALVQAKRLLNTRDVPFALEQLREAASRWGSGDEVMLILAARYLAPTTQERIAAAGAGYVDATGNVRVVAQRPALYLRDRGADRDPWRGPGRPRGTLHGPPAARVVRTLVDFAPPYTVPELAERAGASTGATYRVVELLEGEGMLARERYGPIGDVQWRRVLERWSTDYGFARSNTVATFLAPRGLSDVTDRLAQQADLDYVVTGTLAAERVAPYAPARLATVYVRDIHSAADRLALRPTASGANVALASGGYDIVFDRAEVVDGVRVAALSQVAVDLLTGPGRNPSEAAGLLDWMAANESAWRR